MQWDASLDEIVLFERSKPIDRGAFGSPYVVVDGEPFWGHDRLDQIERWLKTGGF